MKAKRTGALILALALCLSLGAHAAGSTTATVPVTPVSYTHLDVYKRQTVYSTYLFFNFVYHCITISRV